jgi:hypothetical protein
MAAGSGNASECSDMTGVGSAVAVGAAVTDHETALDPETVELFLDTLLRDQPLPADAATLQQVRTQALEMSQGMRWQAQTAECSRRLRFLGMHGCDQLLASSPPLP